MTVNIHDFNLESFNDINRCEKYFHRFGLDELLGSELSKGNSDNKLATNVDPNYIVPYGVEIPDLCRLHWICLNRKSTQVLEFGSGYSTLVIANALSFLRTDHNDWAEENTRLQEPFKIYSIKFF